MSRFNFAAMILVALVVTLSSAWRLAGAPLLPRPEKVSDRAMSLAGLESVRLDIVLLSSDAQGLEITAEKMYRDWKNLLEAAGVEVVENDEAPFLSLHLKVLADQAAAGHFAYGLFLTLDQAAHLPRLDRTLTVPTYVANVLGIASEADIREDLASVQAFMARKFLRQLEGATAEVERDAGDGE